MVYGDCDICIESEVISLDSVQNMGFCLSPYRAEIFSKFQIAKEDNFHMSSYILPKWRPMHIFDMSVMYVKSFEKIQTT